MVIIVNDNNGLQNIITKFEEGTKVHGMKINIGKAKVVRLSGAEYVTVMT